MRLSRYSKKNARPERQDATAEQREQQVEQHAADVTGERGSSAAIDDAGCCWS